MTQLEKNINIVKVTFFVSPNDCLCSTTSQFNSAWKNGGGQLYVKFTSCTGQSTVIKRDGGCLDNLEREIFNLNLFSPRNSFGREVHKML